ncbi:hypothetical protein DFJ58DRAFT_728399, partial [Suillus subalutaceus]|uniref:uncharacterized protein n=1 Tax=Suillus subalutaceus TaxID=48586 RepID=UPI001B860DD0
PSTGAGPSSLPAWGGSSISAAPHAFNSPPSPLPSVRSPPSSPVSCISRPPPRLFTEEEVAAAASRAAEEALSRYAQSLYGNTLGAPFILQPPPGSISQPGGYLCDFPPLMPYALAQSCFSHALQSHQAPVQGALLDPHAVGHHAKHIDIMESGWRTYFPLFELCPSTDLLVKRTEVESRAMERSLSFANFCEASQNLILLISSYLASPDRIAIAASWQKHYDLIFGRPDVYSAFATYLIYDESLRMAFPKRSGDFYPSVFQVHVWQSILDQQREERMAKFNHTVAQKSVSMFVAFHVIAFL